VLQFDRIRWKFDSPMTVGLAVSSELYLIRKAVSILPNTVDRDSASY
jgi:hypothetical protein